MTYGHMTWEEWERRAGSPYLEERGRWYRITDHHVIRGQGLERVNYQAVEMTDAEVAAMKAEFVLTSAPWLEPEPPPEKPVLEPVLLDPTPRPFIRPSIYQWALKQPEYKGRGRVSHFLRKRYAKEFGLQLVPGQSPGGQTLGGDE